MVVLGGCSGEREGIDTGDKREGVLLLKDKEEGKLHG
jgi:hypothetical protein